MIYRSATFRALLLPASAALLCTTALATPPTAPTGLTLTWSNAGVINAAWTDRSNNEDGFYVTYRTSPLDQFNIYGTVGPNVATFTSTASSWTGCTSFEWAVFAYKGTGAAQETASSNIVTVIAPPRVTSAVYMSALTGTAFTHTLTTACTAPVWTASPIPPGLTFTAATGVISGIPTAAGRNTVNVTLTAGGKTVNHTLKIHVFRPVPALAAPAATVPLSNQLLRRSVPPAPVDLALHFNDPDVSDATRLVFNTGTMDFVYYPAAAPANVANFKGYITRGDLVNTIIHRSLPGFVLQGGGYKAQAGTPGITRQPPVVNEPEISNTRGTVAMAKSASNPDSATSEFFVSLADNASNLNNQNEGFTVFARVPAAGMIVADAIAALCTFDYSAINGVLPNCPVTIFVPCPIPKPATPAFEPAALVKLISAGAVAPLSYSVSSSAPLVCGASVNVAQLSLTPLAAGTAEINVTATDLDNQSSSRTFNVTVEEHLSEWLAAQGFPSPGDAAASADPDKDGGVNIMEYGLMTNPQSALPVSAPMTGTTTVAANTFLTLAFPVRKFTGPGFLYTVEAAAALNGPWSAVWTSAQGFAHAQVLAATDLPDRTNVTIRDTTVIAPGTPRFVRLRVTDTP